MSDGIATNKVYFAEQDKIGRLWFATALGVSVYDGLEWANYNLLDDRNRIGFRRIKIDEKGVKWLIPLEITHNIKAEKGFGWVDIPLIPNLNGYNNQIVASEILYIRNMPVIAISTEERLYLLINDVWQQVNIDKITITGMKAVGNSVFLTTLKGLWKLDFNSELKPSITRNVFGIDEPLYAVSLPYGENKGNHLLLLASDWFGEVNDGKLQKYNSELQIEFNTLASQYRIAEDKHGRIYFGTRFAKNMYDRNTRRISPLRRIQDFSSDGTASILIDSENNVWFTDLRGIEKISYLPFRIFDKNNGLLEDEVTAILEYSPGNFIFGHNSGYTVYKNGVFNKVEFKAGRGDSQPASRLLDITMDDKGNIWAATGQFGLVKIDPNGGFTRYLQDKAPVTAVFYDKKYGLLVSADFILSTFNNSVLKVHGSPDLKRNYRKFFRIDNKVLVASGEGIYEVVKDSVVQITTGNNKLDNSCFALFKMSNDTILVGTDDGLCTLEGNKIVPYHSGDFTIKKNIYFITKTPEGSFWFGTSDGLIRWDGKNRVRDYQTMDGLAGFELNRSAAVVDSDNNFWVGTSNGLSVISLGRMEEVINPPRIWFESVESASGKVYDLKEDNLIPYNDNSLYFNFRGISFVAESKIEYQVMLEGFDKKFYTLRQTQLQSIRYPNLSPGTYRLIVKAKNRLSDWSRPTYSALIMIDKPFYFKIWFILLAITSIFAATVLVLKYLLSTREQTRLEIMVNDRTKALAESEAKLKDTLDNLEEVVEERTSQLEYSNKTKDKLFSIISHDLRSPFLTILGYSEMLAEDIGEMDVTTARSYAERIKSASNRTLELVDTLLEWSRLQIGGLKVEFEVVDLNSIIDEICALALPQAKQKGLTFTQFVQGDISLTTDPSLLKTILRNLVNNAIKFTNQGGEVKLNAFVTQGIVIISVEDNGIGIPKEMLSHLFVMGDLKSRKGTADEKGTGIGLGLVFDLLKLIGGEISVKSTEGEGSSFTVEIPVDQPLSIEEDPGNKSS